MQEKCLHTSSDLFFFYLLSLSALVINDTTQVSGKPVCLGKGHNFLYRTESL